MEEIKPKASIDITKKIADFSDLELEVIKKYSLTELAEKYNQEKIESNYESLVQKYKDSIIEYFKEYIESNADLYRDDYIDCHEDCLSSMEQDTGFREQLFDDDDVIDWKIDNTETIDDVDEDYIFDWLVQKSKEFFE